METTYNRQDGVITFETSKTRQDENNRTEDAAPKTAAPRPAKAQKTKPWQVGGGLLLVIGAIVVLFLAGFLILGIVAGVLTAIGLPDNIATGAGALAALAFIGKVVDLAR